MFVSQDRSVEFIASSCAHVLNSANQLLERAAYSWTQLSATDLPGESRPICGPDQTLVLIGGSDQAWTPDPEQLRILRSAIRSAMRVCVVGSAVFVPLTAGVLGAKKLSVHSAFQTGVSEMNSSIEIHPGATYHNKSLSSATGPAAAMRMMVELVGSRDGDVAAMALSRDLGLSDGEAPCGTGEHLRFQRMSQGDEVIQEALQMMENHLEDTLTVAQIAEIIGVSPRKLERSFGDRLGRSPLKVYRDLRLHRAHTLLAQTAMPLSEVSVACGFSNVTLMKRWFHQKYGQLPHDVRRHAFCGTEHA
ncbi:MAG: helix-turn-helix domain-containing protein [Pseudomonadota bacterium]